MAGPKIVGVIFGARVRELRERRGLSQEQLGLKAGLDRTYISGVERAVRNPTLRVIDSIAQALGVPITDLFKAPRKLP